MVRWVGLCVPIGKLSIRPEPSKDRLEFGRLEFKVFIKKVERSRRHVDRMTPFLPLFYLNVDMYGALALISNLKRKQMKFGFGRFRRFRGAKWSR